MKKEEQDTISVLTLKELLQFKSAQEFKQDVNQLFYAYLETSLADDGGDRRKMLESHHALIEFFTKISDLPKINPYGNK